MPEITETYRMTGEECFFLKVVVYRMADLESVIDKLLRLGVVTTSMVLSSYPSKPLRPRT
jgi:Lrp/AsnC family leucine-responsive transcriptional regulator